MDERERKRVSRARRREAAATAGAPAATGAPAAIAVAGPGTAELVTGEASRPGHGPSSFAMSPKDLRKLDEILDKFLGSLDRSRTELRLEIAAFLRASASSFGPAPHPDPCLSRAELVS